ncbi:protein kinase family protein [Streptomyces lonarensis]|uniref:Serine/threonine protein kinase n=1 Tax=Streptomyces lonarensis TaxID=700599 RepID=A0A7X6HZF7_9ACTN|nr:protein kinase family protein [Streptomyces lonarensis]NJQ06450.1 serine/threonine protein kinase [Streptomyces lonarensis]
MAERITAADASKISGDAATSGDKPPSPAAERPARPPATARPASAGGRKNRARSDAERSFTELHSGHKLAKRYRLEECITRLDGFSSWRAVDEKLRRAVGVHVLPADHPRSAAVLEAARSTALLADARFVQVLDADRHGDLVHVIHEWLPDATPLSTLLQSGALETHETYEMIRQVSAGMAAAHRAGLAHLRLTPGTVLRTGAGLFRIRGLAVDAALRGITAAHPQRTDTEAAGALLYAALTQRWPYPDGAYGLRGVAGLDRNSRDSLATPEQVRAGVHRGLSDLAMRALVNDGATAASEKPPCVTAIDLISALDEMPRIRPPEPEANLVGYQPTTYQQGTYAGGPRGPAMHGPLPLTPAAPPALPGRMGSALKWGVSALLIAALGLGSWQIADALMGSDTPTSTPSPPDQPRPEAPGAEVPGQVAGGPLPVTAVRDFDPFGETGSQNPDAASYVIDGDPSTFWHTRNYFGPGFGNLKPGLGLILDLGEPRQVSSVTVDAIGQHSMQLLAADSSASGTPSSFEEFSAVDEGVGASVTLTAEDGVESQYLLVWLTELPRGDDGNYRGRITNVTVSD